MGFSIGIANAQGFYVKFIDSDNDGYIKFTAYISNDADQTYYTGIATADHNTYLNSLQIPKGGFINTPVSWNLNPGEFYAIYDVYLTPDPDSDPESWYWTSQGDAEGSSTGATLSIDWFSGNSKIPVFNFALSTTDTFQITAVPVPSALWLLGSGVVALGLVRKKLISD